MHVLLFFFVTLLVLTIFIYLFGLNKVYTQDKYRKLWRKIYLIVCFILLGIPHVLKEPNSIPDITEYIEGFKEISQHDLRYLLNNSLSSLKAEKGYIILNKIISLFTDNPFFLIFVTSLIILSGYYFIIRKYSPCIWMSVFLFMMVQYPQSFYTLRQHMAISIVLFSYPFIIDRNFIKFLIVFLIAFSIHQSAIVFFPVYFLYNIKDIKALIVLSFFLLLFVVTRADLLLEYIIQTLFTDYAYYLNGEESNWKMFALLTSVLLLRIIVMRSNFLHEGIDRLLSIIITVAVLVSYVGIGLPGISRLNMYYSTCFFMVLPNTLFHLKNIYLKAAISMIYVIFFFMFFLNNLHTGNINSLVLSI